MKFSIRKYFNQEYLFLMNKCDFKPLNMGSETE